MSSWRGNQIKIIKKPGYTQKTPQGTFTEKNKPVTVVSAYYTVPSRASQETYMSRLKLFLENIPCHLIFFTDEPMLEFIKECRKDYEDSTIIIPLDRTLWNANIKYPEELWQQQHEINPEKDLHSPDLYKLWYEKTHFVLTAIDLNPFDSDDFIWMDAGIIREPEILPLIKENFPVGSRIPNDRMLLLNVKPFQQEDENKTNNVTGNFLRKDRIAAGIIAGNKDIWHKWADIYDETITRYLAANKFIGKEQSIMSTIVLENRDFVSLINPPKNFGRAWFYSLIYLGVSKNRFTVINSFSKETIESYQSISSIPRLL